MDEASAAESKDELLVALSRASGRLVELVRSLDAKDGRRPVPDLEWTVAETVAHVITVAGRLLGDRRRSSSAAGTAALNALCLEELPERNLGRLANRLEHDLSTVVERVYPKVDFDRQHPFHGGITISGGGGAAFFLCEVLVHGWDVGNATGRTWTISPADARVAVRGPMEVGLLSGVAVEDADPYEVLLGLFRRQTPRDAGLAESMSWIPPI